MKSLFFIASSVLLVTLFYQNQHLNPLFVASNKAPCYPRQIRIQLGDNYSSDQYDYNDLTITFQTYDSCPNSYAIIQQNGQSQKVSKKINIHSKWDDVHFSHSHYEGDMTYDQYVHHILVSMQPGDFKYTIYGDDYTQSETITARLPSKKHDGVQKFLYFGDFDNTHISSYTWNLLKKLWQDVSEIDAIMFLGDYAYEFWQQQGLQGDLFLDTLQPYSSTRPWMFTAGNHEDNYNFTFYNEKFRLPNYPYANNNYYSFDVGMVHFISLNLHFYDDGSDQQNEQAKQQMLEWFESDLKKANLNRKQVPWVIVSGHKALYCHSDECETFSKLFKEFDKLLYKYGVDVYLGAHKHEYQVIKPLYKGEVKGYDLINGNVIKNPKATFTIIQGNGGNRNMEQDQKVESVSKDWMLYRDKHTGVGKMTVYDESHIRFEYFRSDNEQLDYTIDLIKDSHGPF